MMLLALKFTLPDLSRTEDERGTVSNHMRTIPRKFHDNSSIGPDSYGIDTHTHTDTGMHAQTPAGRRSRHFFN
jgi:hypothetical protein